MLGEAGGAPSGALSRGGRLISSLWALLLPTPPSDSEEPDSTEESSSLSEITAPSPLGIEAIGAGPVEVVGGTKARSLTALSFEHTWASLRER